MASNVSLKNKRMIVEGPTEKREMWIFTDTEFWVDIKVVFTWNTLFQSFQNKEFQVILQDDPSTELSKSIYKNISKSGLHWATARSPILPCTDMIEWITQRVDHESGTILNFEDKNVTSYQAPILNRLYHFNEAHVKVTLEWLKQKNDSHYFLSIMKGWWVEGQFRTKSSYNEWKTSKFIKSIQIIVILLARVFEQKYASSFLDKWIPIIYQVITSGSTLN